MTDIAELLTAAVPFVRTLGIRVLSAGADADGVLRATAELPDDPGLHNHVGGPHAGAMFGLGETASGAVVMTAFADQLGRATPLAVRAEVGYLKFATGTISASAELGRPVDEILAELDAGERPEFPVPVEIRRADGAVAARMTVVWTLRPNR